MKTKLLTLCLALAVLFPACKTQRLEPGGAYAPTNSAGVVVYNDTGLALADASFKFSYEAVFRVMKFERDNRVQIWAISPLVKLELDRLRPKIVALDARWVAARKLYKEHPTPEGLSNLQAILLEVQRLLAVAEQQLQPISRAVSKVPQLPPQP